MTGAGAMSPSALWLRTSRFPGARAASCQQRAAGASHNVVEVTASVVPPMPNPESLRL
jgi:hypothetical protein